MAELKMTFFEKSAPNQRRAILALVAGKQVTEAAEAAGVSRTTLYRWQRTDPSFQAALREAMDLNREEQERRLKSMVPKALEVVENILTTPGTAVGARLRAALAVLGAAERWSWRDVETRLDELEGAMQ